MAEVVEAHLVALCQILGLDMVASARLVGDFVHVVEAGWGHDHADHMDLWDGVEGLSQQVDFPSHSLPQVVLLEAVGLVQNCPTEVLVGLRLQWLDKLGDGHPEAEERWSDRAFH